MKSKASPLPDLHRGSSGNRTRDYFCPLKRGLAEFLSFPPALFFSFEKREKRVVLQPDALATMLRGVLPKILILLKLLKLTL